MKNEKVRVVQKYIAEAGDIQEFMRLLNVSQQTAYNWKNGRVPDATFLMRMKKRNPLFSFKRRFASAMLRAIWRSL